jgi:hypothetical protein
MLRVLIFSIGVAFSASAYGASGDTVLQAMNYDEFAEQFCSANRENQHIFVLPVAIFTENATVTCEDGDSGLRTSEPEDDPGHVILNIDPPHAAQASFDCDGKADVAMTTVAINCLPVSRESAEHPKE